MWKPVILWTDPDSDTEYGDRILPSLPDGIDVDIPSIHIGRTARADEWEVLADHLVSAGYNFVVLDNLMGATGDTNETSIVTTVFDGLTRLTSRGVPVVVLHHESEKGRPTAGGVPMGASVAVQKSRVWIQVRQTARRRLRGGNIALVVHSNMLEQSQEIVAEPMQGPAYQVIRSGPWVDSAGTDKPDKPKRQDQTLDLNAEAARFVVDNCQGVGVRQVAKLLADRFPGRKESTWKDQVTRGSVSMLVSRTGEGDSTGWKLV